MSAGEGLGYLTLLPYFVLEDSGFSMSPIYALYIDILDSLGHLELQMKFMFQKPVPALCQFR